MEKEDNESLNDADVFGENFRCLLCKMELSSNIASRIKHQKECASKNKIGKRKLAKLKKESMMRLKKVQKDNNNNNNNNNTKITPKFLKIDEDVITKSQSDNVSNDFNEKKRSLPDDDIVIKDDPIKKIKHEEVHDNDLIKKEDSSRKNNNNDDNTLDGNSKEIDDNKRSSKTENVSSMFESELLNLLKIYKLKFDKLKEQYNEKKEALLKHYYIEIGKLTLEKEEKIELLKHQYKNIDNVEIKKEEITTSTTNVNTKTYTTITNEEKNPILKNDLISNAFDSTVNIHWDGKSNDFDFVFPESQEIQEDSDSDMDDFFSPVFPISSGQNMNDSESSEEDEEIKEKLIVKMPHTKDIDTQLNDRVSRRRRRLNEKKTTVEYIHEIDEHPDKNETGIIEEYRDIDETLTPDINQDEIVKPGSPKTSAIDDLLQKYEFKR